MDFLELDTEKMNTAREDSFSVDDILAEFASRTGERPALWDTDAEKLGYDARVYSPKNRNPSPAEDDDIKLYESGRSKQEEYIDFISRNAEAPEEEFDARFYMGERRRVTNSVSYGGKSIGLEADEDYIPPKTPEASAELWPERIEEEPQDASGLRGKAKKLFKKYRAIEKMQSDDIDRQNEASEEEEDEELPVEDDFPEDDQFPRTFREYLGSLATGFIYKIRGGKGTTVTVDDSGEELGKELSVVEASKYYGKQASSLRVRTRLAAVLLIVMCYVSLGLPVTGMINDIRVASLLMLSNQLVILLLSADVAANAMRRTAEGRPGADTLALLACLITSVDAILVAGGHAAAHMPLCALSSLSMFAVLTAAYLNAKAFRKALRVPAIARTCYAVTGEEDPETGDVTMLKSVRSIRGFLHRSEEASPDEETFEKLSIPLAGLSLIFALLAVVIKKDVKDFIYVLSAFLIAAAPLGALLSFALPYFVGTMRIFSSGAAIAGWSGLYDIGESKSIIVTDRDIFPDGTVELGEMRIFAQYDPDVVVAYAGSVIIESGSCLARPFADLMKKRGCDIVPLENIQYMPSGGIQAVIEGNTVLCGNSDVMRLMNVKVPFRLVGEKTVLLAINGILYGIFNVNYKAEPKVREALLELMRSTRHPVFAIRDFNITPAMLKNSFDIATDGYDFPTYPERFKISSAETPRDSKISALVCREGLGPLTHMADTGRSMYIKIRISLILAVMSAVIGILAVFIKFVGSGYVGIGFLAVWAIVWLAPTVIMSFIQR